MLRHGMLKESLLGRAQSVIPPNLYLMFKNIIAWGPQVKRKPVSEEGETIKFDTTWYAERKPVSEEGETIKTCYDTVC